jgi:hypothetical protein
VIFSIGNLDIRDICDRTIAAHFIDVSAYNRTSSLAANLRFPVSDYIRNTVFFKQGWQDICIVVVTSQEISGFLHVSNATISLAKRADRRTETRRNALKHRGSRIASE